MGFQDPKWHDFVILQGKTLWRVKKRSEALRGVKEHSDWKNPFQNSFFLQNGQKPSFLKTDWEKPI